MLTSTLIMSTNLNLFWSCVITSLTKINKYENVECISKIDWYPSTVIDKLETDNMCIRPRSWQVCLKWKRTSLIFLKSSLFHKKTCDCFALSRKITHIGRRQIIKKLIEKCELISKILIALLALVNLFVIIPGNNVLHDTGYILSITFE